MTKIKICGITNASDALAACDAGADALGFNFSASSPRRIAPEDARAIIAQLPPFVAATGIFVEHSPAEIDEICSSCGLHVAQLHSDSYTAGQALAVSAAKVLRVFRPGPGFSIGDVRDFSARTKGNAFLFDAYSPKMAGGTGETIEAGTAIRLFRETQTFAYAILAGGLNPDNVADAVRIVRPWGVDTASGVESAPGIKDHGKIRAFVDAVREADRDFMHGS